MNSNYAPLSGTRQAVSPKHDCKLFSTHSSSTFDILQYTWHVISKIFWGVTPCTLVEVQLCFQETYCLHLQGRRIKQGKRSSSSSLLDVSGCSLGLLSDPEDGGTKSLRKFVNYGTTECNFALTAVGTSNRNWYVLSLVCNFSSSLRWLVYVSL
jgi:hypothetical protein